MKRISVALFVATALVVVGASAALAQSVPPPDQTFMIEAARDGIAEVELGRLAAQRAASEAVRQFAQRMVTEHGAGNQELMQLAQRKGVTLPQEMGPEHRAAMVRLSALSGAAFDEAYSGEMASAHRQAATLFSREAQQGQDAEVRGWAMKMLPTIQEHQRVAFDLHGRIAATPAAPAVVAVPAPAPAASPATVTTVITTTTPAPPFCGGMYLPGVGTNFGACPR